MTSEKPKRANSAGDARRREIETAAVTVLAAEGYPACTVGRIAREAGVSKGVISYHFASRADLLRGIALKILKDCQAFVSERLEAAGSPAEQLTVLLSAELTFFRHRREEFAAMQEVLVNLRDDRFYREFSETTDIEVAELADVVRDGERMGVFRAVDGASFARVMLAAKVGVLDRWAGGEADTSHGDIAALVDFALRALGAR